MALVFRLPVGPRLWLLFLTMLTAQFSIAVLNEWADRFADARAGRPRPVATGRISPSLALGAAIVFAVLALGGAALFGLSSLLLVGIGLAAGWSYDLFFKPTVFSFLPFAIAFPLLVVWVAVASGHALPSAWLVFMGGAPLAVAVHLADAIPDRAYDRDAGLRTIPVVLGYPRAELLAGWLLIAGLAISDWQLWLHGLWRWPLLSPVVLVGLYFINALAQPSRNYVLTRQVAKFCLIIDAAACGVLLSIVASRA